MNTSAKHRIPDSFAPVVDVSVPTYEEKAITEIVPLPILIGLPIITLLLAVVITLSLSKWANKPLQK